MNLKSYLNIYELLENKIASHEENRAFGLSHLLLKNQPIEQLLAWEKEHIQKLDNPSMSDTLSSYLYGMTLTLVILAVMIGVLSGVGLLSYSGHEPVNVIYFIAMVVFFPLITMVLAMLSMLRANHAQSLLVHISPAFWMEKVLSLLPAKMQSNVSDLKINPLLLNWVMIKRSQLIALFFSLGLLVALLAMVITKDIAFAWSTTLQVTPETFHGFLQAVSYPWKAFYPSAVPSVELIEQSQYFRLGDKLSQEMINNASKLGEWWKFLAMATLFYALILRFLMFLLSVFGLHRAIKKSFLTLSGTSKLLREMNEPIITTHAPHDEELFVPTKESYVQIIQKLDSSYDVVQGWAISKEQLVVLNDSMRVIAPKFFEVGGVNSFEEDADIIAKSRGEVLFFVKGWEPPTMDFVDYLLELSHSVEKVIIMPIGTVENNYEIKQSAIDVWDRKLTQINEEKVWLKR
ncbi:MAG: Unknown protein [uncultured Sulfurovum sp.]|uniref:DUF2868 domain-containing protein n=1 Tax=uncultured Sulfurovum sp. TaxID=269237 RepID=A0A6S6SFH1_9BACT|nr:MAG: Unknown protein [uncultured Sulfurovum sp.]